jgi:hypothetical protein
MAILPLFPRRVQLPISLGLNLLLMPGEHVLWPDVADGAVQTHVVVMLYLTLHQTKRTFERHQASWSKNGGKSSLVGSPKGALHPKTLVGFVPGI